MAEQPIKRVCPPSIIKPANDPLKDIFGTAKPITVGQQPSPPQQPTPPQK